MDRKGARGVLVLLPGQRGHVAGEQGVGIPGKESELAERQA